MTVAERVLAAIAAELREQAAVLARPSLTSVTFVVRIDGQGNPHTVMVRTESQRSMKKAG